MEVGESSTGGGSLVVAAFPPSSSSSAAAATLVQNNRKTVVVRVKRKRCQPPIEAFWLEINERPQKRTTVDLSNLRISDSGDTEVLKNKIFLVQHVETVRSSDEVKGILQAVMPESNDAIALRKKLEERRHTFKQGKIQDQFLSTAREEHKELAKNARFKQIWRSRKEAKEQKDGDSVNSLCQLYDIVRVDNVEMHDVPMLEGAVSSEYDEMLSYLPLLREFIPSAAEEIEADLMRSTSKLDDYEYDVYTIEKDTSINFDDAPSNYPLVQVTDDDFCYENSLGSDCETDDSNAEDNPLFDYPDDPSEEEYDSTDPSLQSKDSDNVDEVEDSDDDLWWGRRIC